MRIVAVIVILRLQGLRNQKEDHRTMAEHNRQQQQLCFTQLDTQHSFCELRRGTKKCFCLGTFQPHICKVLLRNVNLT